MNLETLTSAIDIITGLLGLVGILAFLFLMWIVYRSLGRIEGLLEELVQLQTEQQRPGSTQARH